MSDEDEEFVESPRVRFGSDELRWAFRDRVPKQAIGYLLERAKGPDLRWPILVMLNGIDNPDAVEFVVRELAQQGERMEATGYFSPFAATAVGEWSRRQNLPSSKGHRVRRGGTPMSAASRERLRDLWSCDVTGEHLRRWALQFWCATVAEGDIPILQTIDISSEIGNLALFERLRRGDRMAIPALVTKLDGEHPGHWWRAGRYLWTDELTECLDRALAQRADELTDAEGDRTHDLGRTIWTGFWQNDSRNCRRKLLNASSPITGRDSVNPYTMCRRPCTWRVLVCWRGWRRWSRSRTMRNRCSNALAPDLDLYLAIEAESQDSRK